MKFLYFLVGKFPKDDKLEVFKTYFGHGSWGGDAYLEAFLIALFCAAVFAVIFYLIIGKKMQSLSSIPVWLIMLVTSCAVSFAVTDINTGMSSKTYGLGKTLNDQWKKKTKDLNAQSPQYKELETSKRTLTNNFKKGLIKVAPVRNLCIMNVVYTLLIFLLLSCLLKRFSDYAANIPFK